MRIDEFFKLYEYGRFKEKTISNFFTKEFVIKNSPLEKINIELDVVSIYKMPRLRKSGEKVRDYYYWTINKIFQYREREFVSESACIYDFLNEYKDIIKKRNAFYDYEVIKKQNTPLGVVIAAFEPPTKKDEEQTYSFYFLENHMFNIKALCLEEATRKAKELVEVYDNAKIKKFEEKSTFAEH